MSLIKNVVRTNNQLVSWNEGEEIFSVSRNSDGTPSEIKSRVGRWPKQESTFRYNSLGEFTGMSYPIESAMLPALIAEADNTVTARKQLTGGIEIIGPDGKPMIPGGFTTLHCAAPNVTVAGVNNLPLDSAYKSIYAFTLSNHSGDLIALNDRLDFRAFIGHANSAVGKNFKLYCNGVQIVGTSTSTTQARTDLDYQIWLSADGAFVSDGLGISTQGPFDATGIVLGQPEYLFELYVAFSVATTETMQLRGVSMTRFRSAM